MKKRKFIKKAVALAGAVGFALMLGAAGESDQGGALEPCILRAFLGLAIFSVSVAAYIYMEGGDEPCAKCADTRIVLRDARTRRMKNR